MVFPVNVCKDQNASERNDKQNTQGEHSRKEIIQKVHGILKDLESSKGHIECRCTDPKSPPEGMKLVPTNVLDGKEGVMKLVSSKKSRYIWVPPHVDNRPALDPSHSCYAPTVVKHLYNCDIGTDSDQNPQSSTNKSPSAKPKGDYCEDPSFVAPQPLEHQQWTNEPGGSCKHPQYCKAHCFEHTPDRDWARH